jgi:hypothetical protein
MKGRSICFQKTAINDKPLRGRVIETVAFHVA